MKICTFHPVNQGSVLGPTTFFNLYANDIPPSSNTVLAFYAYDTEILDIISLLSIDLFKNMFTITVTENTFQYLCHYLI